MTCKNVWALVRLKINDTGKAICPIINLTTTNIFMRKTHRRTKSREVRTPPGPLSESKGTVQWGSSKDGYSGGSTGWVQREGTVGGAHWVGAKEGYSGGGPSGESKRTGGVHLRWVHKRIKASMLKKKFCVWSPLKNPWIFPCSTLMLV